MAIQSEDDVAEVRKMYLGKRVRIYRGLRMTVGRVEGCDSAVNCYHFYAKGNTGDGEGYVTTLASIVIEKAAANG